MENRGSLEIRDLKSFVPAVAKVVTKCEDLETEQATSGHQTKPFAVREWDFKEISESAEGKRLGAPGAQSPAGKGEGVSQLQEPAERLMGREAGADQGGDERD